MSRLPMNPLPPATSIFRGLGSGLLVNLPQGYLVFYYV
jgi:hypothetical protein